MHTVGLLMQRLWPVWQWAAGVKSLQHTITTEPLAHAPPETRAAGSVFYSILPGNVSAAGEQMVLAVID